LRKHTERGRERFFGFSERRMRLAKRRFGAALACCLALTILAAAAGPVAAESMECSECGLNAEGECVHREDHTMEKSHEHVSCFLCGAVGQCSGSLEAGDDGDSDDDAAKEERKAAEEEEEAAAAEAKAEEAKEALKTKATGASIMEAFMSNRDRRRRSLLTEEPRAETREVGGGFDSSRSSSLSLDLNAFQPCSQCGVNAAGQCVYLNDLDRRHSRGTISCFLCGYSGVCPHDVTFHCPEGQDHLCNSAG